MFRALAVGVALSTFEPTSAHSQSQTMDDVSAAMARNDYAVARRIAETLAAAGDPEAINGLSVLVANGLGGPADPERANQLLEHAVAAGSLGARLNLARQIANGTDTSQFPRAFKLLEGLESDSRTRNIALYPRGRMMVFGGKSEELRGGVDLLRQSVEFEPTNADAQFLVARSYQGGWGGLERNLDVAFKHFDAAAKLGDFRALRYRGMALLNGEGTTRRPDAALTDFKAAAAGGNVWAMIDIAVMLAVGEGVPADAPQARSWYLKAAKTGSAHALRGLGGMLLVGEGGPRDVVNGRAYIELALSAGDPEAPRLAASLVGPAAEAERAAIDAAKAEWLKLHPVPRAD